jgi:DNA polymerase delta subunit 2
VLDVRGSCLPGLPPQRQVSLSADKDGNADPLLLLVSGLSLGDPKADPLAADLLVDYITGNLGGSADHAEAACIAQVIVAGASCYNAPEAARQPAEAGLAHASGKAAGGGGGDKLRAQHRLEASPLQELDLLLTRLCASVPVDVMAGPGDPCCMYMPQQPLLPCLLPSAKTYNTLRTTTNPYEATIAVKPLGKDKKDKDQASAAASPADAAAAKSSQGVLVMGTSGASPVRPARLALACCPA